jgi:general L-amino acid transport system permease protein
MTETQSQLSTSPPRTKVGVLGWLRANFFSSWFNTLLTILLAVFLFLVARNILSWAITEANWRVITSNYRVLLWGRYPDEEVWRLGTSLGIILVLALVTWLVWRSPRAERLRRWVVIAWFLSFIVIVLLIRGLTLPTPYTVFNNMGYYLFRPDVLLLVDQTWRPNASLFLVGFLVGMTWGLYQDRKWRLISLVALLVMLGISTPLGLQSFELAGIRLPRLLPMLLIGAVAFLLGRYVGRSLSNIDGVYRGLVIAWVAGIPILMITLTSFDVGVEAVAPAEVMPIVEPNIWSGIMLTLMLAVVSIVLSFPIGILLALGRRSSLPVVKWFSVGFIELVRGVPLITILFMAQVMLPLFLPLELTVDRVLRAMAGMTLFTAAYLAEVIRGGLQAVPEEQVEAARALGLSELLVTGLIVLPQALRAVIPPIMGQFVSIFKDTSLVAVVGLLDLIAVGQSVIKQREFLGSVREIYIFAGIFFFVFSYAMSKASQRLEKQLGVGEF